MTLELLNYLTFVGKCVVLLAIVGTIIKFKLGQK